MRLMFRRQSESVWKARVSDRVEAWVARQSSGAYRGVFYTRLHPGLRRVEVGDFESRRDAEIALSTAAEERRWGWCG